MTITNGTLKRAGVEAGEPLPLYAWPGGYPLIYLDDQGNTLCPKCADRHEDYNGTIIAVDAHMEGPPLQCDNCGESVESAYGDPDADTD